MRDGIKSALSQLEQECLDCGACAEVCDLLAELTDSPGELAGRGIDVYLAYSCFLCDRCAAACPLELRPSALFAARRMAAVEKGEIDPEEYNYLLPDRKESVMQLYRGYCGIDYGDLEAEKGAEICFFPGCTLMTYSPVLTREVFKRLEDECGCRGMLTDCCGKPLSQMGLEQRAAEASRNLIEKLKYLGVKRIVVACPGCYYYLHEILGQEEIEILTVYEVLDFPKTAVKDAPLCTVHDSCPDRFQGIFSEGVRAALKKSGFSVVEMAANRRDSPCCGSGGQVSHFRPELAEKLIEVRLREAERSGASVLLAYCLSCVLNFATRPSGVKVRHVLNLLLGLDEDYSDVKTKVLKILEEANAG